MKHIYMISALLHCCVFVVKVRLYNVFKLSQANPPIGVDLYTQAESLLCSQLQGTAVHQNAYVDVVHTTLAAV